MTTTIPGAFLEGHCHCGALRLSFAAATAPAELVPRACACEFCRRHAPHYVSDPQGRIALRPDEPAMLQRYRFATQSADFLLCRRCGTLLGATTRVDGRDLMVLNARILAGPAADMLLALPAAPLELDPDESLEARQTRRARTWTPLQGLPREP